MKEENKNRTNCQGDFSTLEGVAVGNVADV